MFLLCCWPLAVGAHPPPVREHLVDEPIFGGQAFLLEAGRGNSPTLLLVHGLGDQASSTWAGLIEELAVDYHVLAVDLPGFGRSDKLNRLYSPKEYAAYLRWLVDRFSTEPVVLVGHSLGGGVALRFAADYPRQVQRLVLIDVAGILHRKIITRDMLDPNLRGRLPQLPTRPLERIDEWVGNLITSLPQLPMDVEQILASETLRARVLAGDPGRIAGLALVQEDFSRTLRTVQAPTFIIWGGEDQVTPLRTGLLLEVLLPQASLLVIPGAGHVPMVQQPKLFRAALNKALVESPPPRVPPLEPTGRIGICQNEQGLTFSGRYDRLEIVDCSEIRLVDLHANGVTIRGSRVTIEQGVIRGEGTVLRIVDSVVVASGLRVEGDTALAVTASRLDLAGVELIGRETAVQADETSSLLFSVSQLTSSRGRKLIHGNFVVPKPD
ncbi:alpha/beta fold hydrolase [Desulfurivibrio sp. D14AmB]|uniref:alpha/beta fold hydrolase n=1 Tax=Desulfurivibrio sp. D14AmB TaxID=3374370 RepID=UPI00376F25DD